jgi:hypothetical protein
MEGREDGKEYIAIVDGGECTVQELLCSVRI